MPTYIRPKRVTVETGGSWLAWLAAAAAVAGSAVAIGAFINAYLWAIVAVVVTVVTGSLAYLAYVLHREGAGLSVSVPPRGAVASQPHQQIPVRPPAAIPASRIIPGVASELAEPAVRLVAVRPVADDGKVAR